MGYKIMTQISRHSKERIVERTSDISSLYEANKVAKIAFKSGKNINEFQRCPKFCDYLRNKKMQANDCSIRVYKDNIYIWRGRKHTLVTAHPIPDRFKEELEMMNK